jgi:excisionase family DNA binding protein
MNISDYFYTSGQAARQLGINRITIWRWIKDAKFSVQYIGREALIPKWEVELIKQTRNRVTLCNKR